MLDNFMKFFGVNEEFSSDNLYEDFCLRFSKRSFGEGLFNTFPSDKRSYWNDVVGSCFPKYKGKISVIGYDWLGRIFATLSDQDSVRLFEVGTGEVLNIGCSVESLLDEEIPMYPNDALALKFFNEWKKTNNISIPYGSCVSYKIPLFLNGKDVVSNLELSDMDVYWSVVGPLIKK